MDGKLDKTKKDNIQKKKNAQETKSPLSAAF